MADIIATKDHRIGILTKLLTAAKATQHLGAAT